MLRHAALAFGALLCASLSPASEPGPPVPYEKEPAAWQRAGIEAALKDPSVWVQLSSLYYCVKKKWVAQLRISPAQWLFWLNHPEQEVQEMAAQSAAQLGAQMPPEVQRALARLQNEPGTHSLLARKAAEALVSLGAAMIPEVQQAELAFLQTPHAGYEMQISAAQALGQLGAGMPPATLQALLALMQDTQAPGPGSFYAADALAHLGPHMPVQVREIMLRLLLDPQADENLRCTAVEAMGRLGPQMPPQAQQFLLTVLRDRAASKSLRYVAAPALAQLGPRLPPEVPQALLAAYDEQPPGGADEDTRKHHDLFHDKVAEALGQLGQHMPPSLQQDLLALFLKSSHTLQPDTAIIHSLQKTGPRTAPTVLHALLAALQDETIDEQARSSISTFFQRLAEPGHLPLEIQRAVITLMQDESADHDARCQAALILGALGEKAPAEATRALLTLLRGKDPELRVYVLQAMESLGSRMPPEAIPILLTILKQRSAPAFTARGTAAPADDISAFIPGHSFSDSGLDPLDHALPALGQLGAQMPAEAPAALLATLQEQKALAAALALARLGDKLPPQIQQSLITLLHDPTHHFRFHTVVCMTLGVSGVHPVSDAQLTDILSLTREGFEDELRFYFYLWLGRSPAHLLAVRWLGHQGKDPPLGDTSPHEILSLISRLWPHAARHAELRHEMARRSSQIIITHVKPHPLDDATQKVLRSLSTQLAEDTAPDCSTALAQVKAALTARH